MEERRIEKVYYVQNEMQTKFLQMLQDVEPRVATGRIDEIILQRDTTRLTRPGRMPHMKGRIVRRIRFPIIVIDRHRPLTERLLGGKPGGNREHAAPLPGNVDTAIAHGNGANTAAWPVCFSFNGEHPTIQHLRFCRIGTIDREDAIVRLSGEDDIRIRARTGRPHVETTRVERRIVDAPDTLWIRRVGDVKDIKTVPTARTSVELSELADLRRVDWLVGQRRIVAVLGVMPRGRVEVLSFHPYAIAIPPERHIRDLTNVLHVARIEDGETTSAPVTGINIAIAILDALALVGLPHRDMRGMVGV